MQLSIAAGNIQITPDRFARCQRPIDPQAQHPAQALQKVAGFLGTGDPAIICRFTQSTEPKQPQQAINQSGGQRDQG
ncbi:hypothetical protein D3C78_1668290 [compost metagenome]